MARFLFICLLGVTLAACSTKAKPVVTTTTTTEAPTTTTTTVVPVPTTVPTTTTTVKPRPVVTAPPATQEPAPEPEVRGIAVDGSDIETWVAIGRCEQPGDGWNGVWWSHRGPTYQGGLGFWYGTWDSFKQGTSAENIDNAGDATWEQQMEVARKVRDRHGYRAWGCAARLGIA